MKRIFLIMPLFFSLLSHATFTLNGTTITQTGGTNLSRDTPQGIIDAGYGTLVGRKTIDLGNNNLLISGFYDDTGWKYIYGVGRRFRSSGTADWLSGYAIQGQYLGGATHLVSNPTTSSNDNSNIYLDGGIIKWYDVTVDAGDSGVTSSRIRFRGLDSSSELVIRLENTSYLVNDIGNIALLEIITTSQTNTSENAVIMRVGTQFASPDKLLMIAPQAGSGANIFNALNSNPITVSDLSIATGGSSLSLYHNRGVDKRYILKNPSLNLANIKIYNNSEIVQVDTDVSISLSGTHKEGYKFIALADADNYNFGTLPLTDVNGSTNQLLVDVWNGSGNTVASYSTPTTIVDRTDVNFNGINYLSNILSLTASDLGSSGRVDLLGVLTDDISITQLDKTTVDAYTEIETAQKFYDIAKAYLLDNYAGETAIIVTRLGNEIDAGAYDVDIDATAANTFAFDGSTITIKATEFTGSITTTGTVSLSNGATIFGGYKDSTGINKFVYLDWGSSITLDVEIEELDMNTIITTSSATQIYKNHFLFPDPAPAGGVRVNIVSDGGFSVYQEIIPEDVLTFIRKDVTLTASEGRQNEMIFLAKKLLQKTEAINNTINGVTPPFNGTLTITNIGGAATNENQVALLVLLRQILLKITASRNSFE